MDLLAEEFHIDLTLPSKLRGEIRLLDLLEPLKNVRETLSDKLSGASGAAPCGTVLPLRRSEIGLYQSLRVADMSTMWQSLLIQTVLIFEQG